jgi:hypothetical protein
VLAASSAVLTAVLGAALLGPVQTAAAHDDALAAGGLGDAGPAGATRVVEVGGGARVAVTVGGNGEPADLQALPGADGARPGVVTQRTDSGTTVQTTDPGSVPTQVLGRRAPRAPAADAGSVPIVVRVVGRGGRPAEGYVTIFDLEHGTTWTRQVAGGPVVERRCTADPWAQSSCALVPPGSYSGMALVSTLPAEAPSIGEGRTFQNVALVGLPETTVDAARTVTLDASQARRMTVRTPGQRTKVPAEGMLQIGYDRTAADGSAVHIDMHPSVLLDQHFYLQPTAEVSVGTFQTRARIRLQAPDIAMSSPLVRTLHPEYVDSVWFADFDSDFPLVDGVARPRVIDVGRARPRDLAGLRLHGALALVTHVDGVPVAEQSNRAAAHGASMVVVRNDGPGDLADPEGTGVQLRVPTIRLNRAEGRALARIHGRRLTVSGEPASPYVYDLYLKEQGRIPDDVRHVVRTDETAAETHEVHGQPTRASTFGEAAYPFQPGETMSISRVLPFRGDARSRVEYRLLDPDTRWRYMVTTPEPAQNAMFPQPEILRMTLLDPDYHVFTTPGASTVPIGAAPVITGPNVQQPVERSGDDLRVAIEAFVDQDGNPGIGYSDGDYATRLEIRAGQELVAETDNIPYGIVTLPAGPSTVSVHFTTDNPQAWAELSTHTESTWTFPSSTTPGGEPVVEALLIPDYDVDVDLRNRVRSEPGEPVSFDLGLSRPEGATPSPVATARLDASYDDGATWQEATLVASGDRWQVTLPPGSGLVSLRLRAEDTGGSTVDQTVVRAFAVTG